MSQSKTYRTTPADLEGMPPGIPYIIGNETAERFSFYGMKGILAVYIAHYLYLMGDGSGTPTSEAAATSDVHFFNFAVYLTPLIGALLSDLFWGKYSTIIRLSLVYCLGHAALALTGVALTPRTWLLLGLGLIAVGSGGIKPCVSAHVGDQFGARNQHLLPQVFNWFYFSINTGALASTIITPWLLEWYGPHWAFGVPGVLMALATLMFWIGRHHYIHVPAAGSGLLHELISGGGLKILVKLLPLYALISMFWALFDQTGSTWIFQAMDMDREFLGIDWLPSQIQSLNSVFVLTFIPLFALFLYPLVNRFWKLTALRKIGIGLFLMVLSFLLVTLIQTRIDLGQRPSISWQILAFALLTASEVMVSIVALEFAYTQAPKTMKSFVMCFYLGAVAFGNLLVAGINRYIEIPDAAQAQAVAVTLSEKEKSGAHAKILPGYDGKIGTEDDFVAHFSDGHLSYIYVPALSSLADTAERIRHQALELDKPPTTEQIDPLGNDAWGNPIEYQILNSTRLRLISAGPDKKLGTRWDTGILIHLPEPEKPVTKSWFDRFHPETSWLDRRKAELNVTSKVSHDRPYPNLTFFSGGITKLQGAAYFRFFTYLMLATALAFIPFSLLYKPKTLLQD